MKLNELTVSGFLDLLASDAPAPGGGSAAGLHGALGAALTSMVACLTQGRKKYEAFAPFAAEAERRAGDLCKACAELMDRDTEAFQRVSAAFALPRDTEENKAVRSEAVQAALRGCTETPLETMALCADGIRLTSELLANGYNDSAASDLGVAFLSFKAGMQSAWLNVLINVGSLKDRSYAEAARVRGEALLAEALPAADGGYQRVLSLLAA